MAATVYVIDTQLLVLLVVGYTSRDQIGRHKRSKEYSVEDFDSLIRLLGNKPRLLVTPHVLAETSNLLRQTAEPLCSNLLETLGELIQQLDERVVAARVATRREEFLGLGLTDAALLAVTEKPAKLLTADLKLSVAAKKAGLIVINFAHHRQAER